MVKVFEVLKEWLEEQMPEQFSAVKPDMMFLKKFTDISQKEYFDAQHECLRFTE